MLMLARLGLALLLCLIAAAAGAQGWPNKPIGLVVAYPPGGPTDLVGRLYAASLKPRRYSRVPRGISS